MSRNTRKIARRLGLVSLGLLALSANTTYGAVVFSNPITGTNPNLDNPYTTGQVFDSNITVTGIGRGAGALGSSANDRYNANSWNTTTLDTDAYFTWTMQPNSGFEIDFSSLDFTYRSSSSTSASFLELRSSADGFTSSIYNQTITTFGGGGVSTSANLAIPSLQNITTPIEFRLYGWSTVTTNPNGSLSINDFTFNGAVNSLGGPPTGSFWDPNGATAGIGGSGTWDSVSNIWAIDNTGTSVGLQNVNQPAKFEGTAGIVTVSGIVSPASGLTFNTNGYTITGGTEITLAGLTSAANSIVTPTGITATIESVLGGTTGFTKTGPGILNLFTPATVTGHVTVNDGTLIYGAADLLPDSNDLIIDGATVDIGVHNDSVNELVVLNGANLSGTGTISTTSFEVGSGIINANVGGAGNFIKFSTGTATLGGANTFTGNTTVANGVVELNSPEVQGVSGPLGNVDASTVETLFLTGGTLKYSILNQFDYSGRFSGNPDQRYNVNTNGQNVTWAASNLISTGGILNKSGNGTLTVSGVNAYTGGSNITGGSLVATDASSLGTGTVSVVDANLYVANGVTLANNLVLGTTGSPGQVLLAGWDFSPIVGAPGFFGASPYAATQTHPQITSSGLVRGTGFTFGNFSGASFAWGAPGFDSVDAAATIAANKEVTFTIVTSDTTSLTQIAPYTTRQSSTGAKTGQWQYSVGAGPFVDLGGPITWGPVQGNPGNPQAAIELNGISALQNLPSGTTVTFRLLNYGGVDAMGQPSATGTWYFNDFSQTSDIDLQVQGLVGNTNPTVIPAAAGINTAGTAIFTGNVTAQAAASVTAAAGGTAEFQGVISGNGGIDKIGPGTVIFTNANTYLGNTNVDAGTLLINNTTGSGTGIGGIAVNANATLGGTGIISGVVTPAVNGIIAPGSNGVGTLTLDGGLTLNSAILNFELGAVGTNDLLQLNASALDAGGTSTFNFTNVGGFGLGTYTLIDYGTLLGSVGNFSISNPTLGGFSLSLANSGTAIVLNVTPGGPAFNEWIGASGANWTTAGSWSPAGAPNSATAEARFLGMGDSPVVLDANQTVNKLTFNTVDNYFISGTPGRVLSLAGTNPTISVNGGATQSIETSINLGNNTAVNIVNGTLVFEQITGETSVIGTNVVATISPESTLELGGENSALGSTAGNKTKVVTVNFASILSVTGGNQVVGHVSGPGTGAGTAVGSTTISSQASLTANGLRQNSLTLAAGTGTAFTRFNAATVDGGANGLVVLDSVAADVPALTLGNESYLDLNDNDLVLFYGGTTNDPNPLATITQYVDNFYANGSAPGAGVPVIGSSTVENSGGSRILIPVDNANSQFGNVGNPFYDLTLGDANLGTGFNQVIVRFTYPGDYNLDGQVDGADYVVVDSNLGTTTPGLSGGWTLGDGDFDGLITPADYLPIDSNFGSGVGNPLGGNPVVSAIPEPSAWLLGSLAAIGLGAWSRRRKA